MHVPDHTFDCTVINQWFLLPCDNLEFCDGTVSNAENRSEQHATIQTFSNEKKTTSTMQMTTDGLKDKSIAVTSPGVGKNCKCQADAVRELTYTFLTHKL